MRIPIIWMSFEVIDIETINEKDKLIPYCICISNKEKIHTIYGIRKIKKLLDYLVENNIKQVYAHNLSFDGIVMIWNLPKEANYEATIIKMRIYRLIIQWKGFTIEFKCSYQLLPLPVEKMGEKLNIIKKEINHSIINLNNIYKTIKIDGKENSTQDTIEEYCRNDVKIVKIFLKNLYAILEKHKNILENSLTLPSFSITLFKIVFNNKKISIKMKKEEDILFREGYHGGRCEIFGNPKQNEIIMHFDFSGHYAFIMKNSTFFHGNYYKIVNPRDYKRNGFYRVNVTSDIEIPIIPLKNNGKLLFPNGTFSTFITQKELLEFEINGGKINRIEEAYIFEKDENCFKEFIENQERMIKLGGIYKDIGKLINNSVPGKLGMSPENTETLIIDESEQNKHTFTAKINLPNNKMGIVKAISSNEVNSNVIIASQITAYGRIRLHRGMNEVLKNNGRILYTDTDSIFAAFKEDMTNRTIGEIFYDSKKKDTKISDAIFIKPKVYGLKLKNNEEIIKIKGIKNPNKATTFEELKEKSKNKESLFFSQSHFNKKELKITISDILKEISLKTEDKRIWKNEFETEAIKI